MGRQLSIGDIHGNYRGLKQVLDRSGFDYENDQLITLGDIVDGFGQVYECVEELLKIKNRIDITGNHDKWFEEFLLFGQHLGDWVQGGKGTLDSYSLHAERGVESQMFMNRDYTTCYRTNLMPSDIPKAHIQFFKNQHLYYIDDKNRLFVHGGYNRRLTIREAQSYSLSDFYWNRVMWEAALSCKGIQKLKTEDKFNEIFIGHTATTNWKINTIREEEINGKVYSFPYREPITTPMNSGGVWNLDTGGGMIGKLTIMDIDTHEYWQSDLCDELYPGERSR